MGNRVIPASAPLTRLKTNTTVVFAGHARLPQGLADNGSSFVSVELEVDVLTGMVIALAAKAVSELGTKLLEAVLLGRNINEGPQEPVEEIRCRYIAPYSRAVCTAVVNAYGAYHRYREAAVSTS